MTSGTGVPQTLRKSKTKKGNSFHADGRDGKIPSPALSNSTIPGTSFLRGSVFQGILRQTSVYHKTPLSGFNTQNPGRMQPSTSAFGNEPATTAAGNGPAIRKLSPHGKRTGIPFIAGNNGLTPPSNGKSTFRPLPSE